MQSQTQESHISNQLWTPQPNDLLNQINSIVNVIAYFCRSKKGDKEAKINEWKSLVGGTAHQKFHNEYHQYGGVIAKYLRATSTEDEWVNVKEGIKKEDLLTEEDWMALNILIPGGDLEYEERNQGDRVGISKPVTENDKSRIRRAFDTLTPFPDTQPLILAKHMAFIYERLITPESKTLFESYVNTNTRDKTSRHHKINELIRTMLSLIVFQSTPLAILEEDPEHGYVKKTVSDDIDRTTCIFSAADLQISTLKNSVNQLFTGLQAIELQKNLKAEDINNLLTCQQDLNTKVSSFVQPAYSLAESEYKYKMLKRSIQDLQTHNASITNNVNLLISENNTLKERLEYADTMLFQAAEAWTELDSANSKLEEEKHGLQSHIDGLQSANNALENEVNAYKVSIPEYEEEQRRIQEALEKEKLALQAQINDLQSANTALLNSSPANSHEIERKSEEHEEPSKQASSLTEEQKKEIQNIIDTLTAEKESSFNFFGQSRKQDKIDGLEKLLSLAQTQEISAAIAEVKKDHPNIEAGFFSKRTANFLNDLMQKASPPALNENSELHDTPDSSLGSHQS